MMSFGILLALYPFEIVTHITLGYDCNLSLGDNEAEESDKEKTRHHREVQT